MKYLIFGDSHGKDMQKLEKAISIENPDVLVDLGDHDQIQTIRDFMAIEKQFLKDGKQTIKVAGNHDYAILKNEQINSSTLRIKGKTSYQLHQELFRDKEAYNYMSSLINSDFMVRGFIDKDKFEDKFPFVVVHGAYAGNISNNPECPEELKPLWCKLISDKDISPNFDEMKKRGEKIMIRGHDHFPLYYVKDSKGEDGTPTCDGDRYELSEDKLHIINPGAFLYGHYATIDSSGKTPFVEYRNV